MSARDFDAEQQQLWADRDAARPEAKVVDGLLTCECDSREFFEVSWRSQWVASEEEQEAGPNELRLFCNGWDDVGDESYDSHLVCANCYAEQRLPADWRLDFL